MAKRVLITGASGFIGKRLAGALASEGWQVRAASRDPSSIPARSGVERAKMPDLTRPADWSGLLDGVSHVVHLAGIAHAPGLVPDETYTRINAEAAGEFAAAARGKVERFVFMSSVRAQAGLSAERPISETDPASPTTPMAEPSSKASGWWRRAALPSPCSARRWFMARASKAISRRWPPSPRRRCRFPSPASTTAVRCWRSTIWSSAVALVLEAEAAANGTFLAADAEPISVADLVAAMREGLGRAPHS